MNHRPLFALPLALLAAPAVAGEGVFAWLGRYLAKRNVDLTVGEANDYPSLNGAVADLKSAYARHVEQLGPGDTAVHATGPRPKLTYDFSNSRSYKDFDISFVDRDGTTFRMWTEGERMLLSRRRA